MYQHYRSSAVNSTAELTVKNAANMYKTATYGCVSFPERHAGLGYIMFGFLGLVS